MLDRTDTSYAPWSLVEGDSKRWARVKVVETVIAADPSKLIQVISPLSQEFHLGWIKITSNVPGKSSSAPVGVIVASLRMIFMISLPY